MLIETIDNTHLETIHSTSTWVIVNTWKVGVLRKNTHRTGEGAVVKSMIALIVGPDSTPRTYNETHNHL